MNNTRNSNSSDSNIDTEGNASSQVSRKHDLFQDPALARSLEEDPVANFILANWKYLAVVLLAVIGFFYLRTQIRSTTDVRVAESSETFDRARSSVIELLANQKKDSKEKKLDEKAATDNLSKSDSLPDNSKLLRSAKDSLNALKSGPEPYAALAPFYEDLLKKIDKPSDASAENIAQNVAWQESNSQSKRLILELQELSNARTLLDSDNTFKEGLSRLQKLSSNSLYVRGPAVLTLLRVVESPTDIASAVSLAQDIVKIYPENADKIEVELKRLM